MLWCLVAADVSFPRRDGRSKRVMGEERKGENTKNVPIYIYDQPNNNFY